MNCICNKCKENFSVEKHDIRTIHSGDIDVEYFCCPKCGRIYHVLTTDAEMRKLICERMRLAQSVRLARAKRFREKAIKKLLVEIDKIKAKQETHYQELKPIGKKILAEMQDEAAETGGMAMLKDFAIWKAAVVKRNYRCPNCGGRVGSTTGEYNPDDIEKHGKRRYLLCGFCATPVAYIETREVPVDGNSGG